MSNQETGHVKNVSNFGGFITFCVGYGVSYNPSNQAISLRQLNSLLTTAQSSLAAVNSAYIPWDNAVNEREKVFTPLSKLITRVFNSLASCGVSDEVVESARTFVRKIQGRRAAPKDTPAPENPGTPSGEGAQNISASQMGFDNRIDNLDKLIKLLIAQPAYAPNEAELTTASLTALLENMKTVNKAVVDAYTPLSNARIERNRILYSPKTGLVDIAADVKRYVKSLFGAGSPQFKQVSGLRFVVPKM